MGTSKLIKNSAIYTIGDLLPKFISVLMIPIYTNTNYLSLDQKGIVDSIMFMDTIL